MGGPIGIRVEKTILKRFFELYSIRFIFFGDLKHLVVKNCLFFPKPLGVIHFLGVAILSLSAEPKAIGVDAEQPNYR